MSDTIAEMAKIQGELLAEAQAGRKAMEDACKHGNNTFIPANMTEAAKFIADLFARCDEWKEAFESRQATLDAFRQDLSKAVTEIVATATQGTRKFECALADSLKDAGLKYTGTGFSGNTPMLAAAEAAAVITHHKRDIPVREGYLRSRGWRLTGTGWFKDGTGLPFEAAVLKQAETDAAPFKQLADENRDVTRKMKEAAGAYCPAEVAQKFVGKIGPSDSIAMDADGFAEPIGERRNLNDTSVWADATNREALEREAALSVRKDRIEEVAVGMEE